MGIFCGLNSTHHTGVIGIVFVAMVTLGVVSMSQSTTSMTFTFLMACIVLPSFRKYIELGKHCQIWAYLGDCGQHKALFVSKTTKKYSRCYNSVFIYVGHKRLDHEGIWLCEPVLLCGKRRRNREAHRQGGLWEGKARIEEEFCVEEQLTRPTMVTH